MGCDIHCYIEYKPKEYETFGWRSFGGRIYPGRNYALFACLAGVRGGPALIPVRGCPKDIGYETSEDFYLKINDEYNSMDVEGYCSNAEAERYISHGSIRKDNLVSHPDWHSHSWCNSDELELCLKKASEPYYDGTDCGPYSAILAAMRALEKHNLVRFVYWFDN